MYIMYRKWDYPEIEDWDDNNQFRNEDDRQLLGLGLLGLGLGLGFGCYPRRYCWPRYGGCWPRRYCWPRQGCWPRHGGCWPRQGCWPI